MPPKQPTATPTEQPQRPDQNRKTGSGVPWWAQPSVGRWMAPPPCPHPDDPVFGPCACRWEDH